jgi:hypothetical protein
MANVTTPFLRIAVPKVRPIQTGLLSFSGVLNLEKKVDALYASGGLAQYQVPTSKAPKRIIESGFSNLTTFKLPLSTVFGKGQKGSVWATRVQDAGQDRFALFSARGTKLAVRQLSSDYPAGFFWTNYRIR